MSGLAAFFKQNAVPVENVYHVASMRFLDDDGKPWAWEIKAITSVEDEALRQSCTNRVQVPGKKHLFTPELDYNKYTGKLAAACTVFPDLGSVELQDSYGVMGADNVLKAMLTPGEYAGYLQKVQEVNGHDVTMEELKEEAKN